MLLSTRDMYTEQVVSVIVVTFVNKNSLSDKYTKLRILSLKSEISVVMNIYFVVPWAIM
jgi:hypothetical protein